MHLDFFEKQQYTHIVLVCGKAMTTVIFIKKDPSFLKGLNSLTWLLYPKIRGFTKHHMTKLIIFVDDPVNDPVNDPVKSKILQHLKQNPKANYRELADKTGYSTATIKRHIQELKKMGIIERIGSDKTGIWKIAEQ